MEKKANANSRRKDACEKMYKAVNGCCPVVQAIRRVSHRAQGPRPASPAPSSSPSTSHVKNNTDTSAMLNHKSMEAAQLHCHNKRKNGEATEVIPVIFEQPPPSDKPKPAASNGRVANVAEQNCRQGKKDNPKFETPHVNKEEGKKSGMHLEDRFTDYINRAKIKLRTMSHVGDHEENASGKDHKKASGKDHNDNSPVKDKFAEFINRAKIKIRSTSNIGVEKHNSIK